MIRTALETRTEISFIRFIKKSGYRLFENGLRFGAEQTQTIFQTGRHHTTKQIDLAPVCMQSGHFGAVFAKTTECLSPEKSAFDRKGHYSPFPMTGSHSITTEKIKFEDFQK